MAVGQSEYRETFAGLAAGQVWIANCPTIDDRIRTGENPVDLSISDPGNIPLTVHEISET